MKRRIAFCLLLLVCVLVYFKVLQADFLYYCDDQVIVMNQYTVGGWSWNNLWHICTDFHAGQYAPVMEMNFLTLYTFFGYNPFWFHLANLCWHLGCVCLTGLFIVELLKTHGPLAMRHITQLLSEEIPQFQDMSSSKKRRLIMNALEKGNKMVKLFPGEGPGEANYE